MPSQGPEIDSGVIEDRRRRRLVLAGVCAALIAVQGSVAGLTVGMPAIAVDLRASPGEALWIINAYTLVLAALLMPLGAIGDRIGRRPVLLGGLVVFGLACAGASQASSPEVLIALRVVAGIGGAMILPATLSIITSSFPEEHRATAIGIWAGCAGAGGMAGLVGASLILDQFSWPWVFAALTAPAVVGFIIVFVTVPDSREGREHPFDWRGALLSAAAIGGLVLAIQEGPERGWTDLLTLVGIAAAVIGLAGWIAVSLRVDHPLFDLRLLRVPKIGGGSFALLVLFAANFGMSVVVMQYLIAVLEFTPVKAGLSVFPMGLVMVVIAPLAPRIAGRFGAARTLAVGLSTAGLGLALLAIQGDEVEFAALVPGLLILGVGMGLGMTPATAGITESLPRHQQGVASALNDTVRELGGALGIAVMGTVLNVGYRSGIDGLTDGLDPELAGYVEDGLASASAALQAAPAEFAAPILQQARDAFVDGFGMAMWVGAGVLVLGAVVSAIVIPQGRPVAAGQRSGAVPVDDDLEELVAP